MCSLRNDHLVDGDAVKLEQFFSHHPTAYRTRPPMALGDRVRTIDNGRQTNLPSSPPALPALSSITSKTKGQALQLAIGMMHLRMLHLVGTICNAGTECNRRSAFAKAMAGQVDADERGWRGGRDLSRKARRARQVNPNSLSPGGVGGTLPLQRESCFRVFGRCAATTKRRKPSELRCLLCASVTPW